MCGSIWTLHLIVRLVFISNLGKRDEFYHPQVPAPPAPHAPPAPCTRGYQPWPGFQPRWFWTQSSTTELSPMWENQNTKTPKHQNTKTFARFIFEHWSTKPLTNIREVTRNDLCGFILHRSTLDWSTILILCSSQIILVSDRKFYSCLYPRLTLGRHASTRFFLINKVARQRTFLA